MVECIRQSIDKLYITSVRGYYSSGEIDDCSDDKNKTGELGTGV